MSMEPYTRRGARVKFMHPLNGSDHDIEMARCAGLKVGEVYIVEGTDVGSWKTFVFLKGHGTNGYNSVMFENYSTVEEIKEICADL